MSATQWLSECWTTAEWAQAYADLGWRLCGIAPRSKRPVGKSWQVSALPPGAWFDAPEMGIGLIHEGSGTCSLDVDDEDETRGYLARLGVDYDAVLARGCRIDSGKPNRAKLLFRLPKEGAGWTRHQIQTPDKRAMLDLRCGRTQDVLPPSIHPDTRAPYRWQGTHPADLQDLPDALVELWVRLESRNKPTPKARAAPARVLSGGGRQGESVIARFNQTASIGAILERAGYIPAGARWVAPQSSTGDPGVVLLTGDDGTQRVYSHHGSDVLGDGYAHDAFSVWCQLEHGGNVQAAVRQAAADLELEELPCATRIELDAMLDAEPEEESEEPPVAPEPEVGAIPVPACEALRAWLYSEHHAPKPAAAMQAALSIVCHTAARRYCLPSGQSLAVWLGVTDTSAAGHDALFGAVREAIAEHLDDLASLRGTSLSSSTPLYRHLLRTPRVYWATDELGHMVAMTRRQQSGAYETALAVLTSCYEGRTLYVDPDTATRSPKDQRPDEERRIYHPAASVLAFIGHDQIGALAARSEYGRGMLQRLCVVDAGASADPSPGRPWPSAVSDAAGRLADMGMGVPMDAPHVPPDLTVVAWNPHAVAAWSAWQRETLAVVVGDDTTRPYRGLVRGYAQTAMRIASALAAWEEPGDPVVTPGLASWACSWAGRCLASVLPVISTASTQDGQPDPAQDAERAILRAGPRGCTARELARTCRAFRRLGQQQRVETLQRLAADGFVVERATARKLLLVHHTFCKVAP